MLGCQNNRCRSRRQMSGASPSGVFPDDRTHQPKSGIPSPDHVRDAAASFHLSTGESLAEASESRVLALVFLRHFGCTFTRQILRGLEEIHETAQAHGADLVLVHMLKDGRETRDIGHHGDVARVGDPKCELYRSFGLGNGGFLELFGPRVWWLGTVSVFKGCGVGYLAGNALQMPGAFLFHHGEIVATQRPRSAAFLPDLPQLFSDYPPPRMSP